MYTCVYSFSHLINNQSAPTVYQGTEVGWRYNNVQDKVGFYIPAGIILTYKHIHIYILFH